MKKFGSRLRKLRNKHGLRQEDLGKIFHVGKSTISQWEKNIHTPNIETIGKLADFFGVNYDYLLGRTDSPQSYKQDNRIDLDAPLRQENFEKALQKIAEIDTALDLPDEDLLKLIRKAKEKFVDLPKPTQNQDGGENTLDSPQYNDNNDYHPDWEKLIPRSEIDVAEATVKVQEIVYEHQLPEEARRYLTRRVIEIYGKPEYPKRPRKAAHGPKLPGQIKFDDEYNEGEDKE